MPPEISRPRLPLREPDNYRYEIYVAQAAEMRRRGSVVGSWLLDLTAAALHHGPTLTNFQGRVSDSGEGPWKLHAAIDEGVPAPVTGAALYSRLGLRGNSDFANRILSVMRFAFGGHVEKHA